jgi:uncharacterized membrane protein
MEILLREWASHVALAAELCTVICVAIGGLETIARTLWVLVTRKIAFRQARRAVWTGFAAWIVLALEFALAADIARTAIAPTWDDIGRLAAIAVIRTALNYFLERDLSEFNPEPALAETAGEGRP